MIFGSARSQKSQQLQTAISRRAYHGEIGREATAPRPSALAMVSAYHGEIGREATATRKAWAEGFLAYHGEIGREATADKIVYRAEG